MCSVLQDGLLLAEEKTACLEEVLCAERSGMELEAENNVVGTTNQS